MLTFDYAYRKRSASNDEWLKVYISKDCGETWVLRKNIHDEDLSPISLTSSYTPGSTDWATVEVTNITSTYFVQDFRFKFRFENDNGNNLYLDNINIYPAAELEIEENELPIAVLSPNPTADVANLSFANTVYEYIEVDLITLDGKLVDQLYKGNNTTSLLIDTKDLPTGLYIVRIKGETSLQTLKLQKK